MGIRRLSALNSNPGFTAGIFACLSEINIQLHDHPAVLNDDNGELAGIKTELHYPSGLDGELWHRVTVPAVGVLADGEVMGLTAVATSQRADGRCGGPLINGKRFCPD